MRHHALLACCLGAILALAPVGAYACGIPLEAQITHERALLIVEGPRQQLITSVDLIQADPQAAVIFPVPGRPEVDQPPGGEELFSYLEQATRPEIRREQRLVWRVQPEGLDGGAPAGAQLIGRETIGGYDVSRLAADDGAALLAWLAENGYSLPPPAEPILGAYAAEGWSFVAVKLAAAAPEGSLAPLRISYTAERPVYPMRLGALSDRPVSVDLYLLGDGRYSLDALETAFAGPVDQLDPPPPAELAGLLTGAYLTKLRGEALEPASLGADFLPVPAPDNTPYREVVTVYEEISILQRGGLIMGLFCVVILSSLALGTAIGVRRRIDALSPDE